MGDTFGPTDSTKHSNQNVSQRTLRAKAARDLVAAWKTSKLLKSKQSTSSHGIRCLHMPCSESAARATFRKARGAWSLFPGATRKSCCKNSPDVPTSSTRQPRCIPIVLGGVGQCVRLSAPITPAYAFQMTAKTHLMAAMQQQCEKDRRRKAVFTMLNPAASQERGIRMKAGLQNLNAPCLILKV